MNANLSLIGTRIKFKAEQIEILSTREPSMIQHELPAIIERLTKLTTDLQQFLPPRTLETDLYEDR